MSTPALHDQPARDRFQTDLDTNFCVSAGAGVGKTTAIVRRVAELARRNPEALGRLVVVTYTNSAAEELRVRARTLLLQGAAGEGSALLQRFRHAFFGTIHSFCLKLVREFGSEFGISPETGLLEEEEAENLWARFCESPALDAIPLDPDALGEVTRFLSFDQLLELASKIEPAQAERILSAPAGDRRPALDFAEALADSGGRSAANTRENQAILRDFLEEFEAGALFLQIPSLKGGSKSFLDAYQRGMFPFAAWLDREAARLAAQIALGYRDYRRDQRLMTYADQIAWCRRLTENTGILEALRARDHIILLDEAQDTDASMFAILNEITRPPGAPIGEWPGNSQSAAPRPGRFCFVGDEQQSIFASRANLAVYKKYIDAYSARHGGERLEFSVTMRCPVRVIGIVNAIFSHQGRLRQTHFDFRELHPKPECVSGEAWLLRIEPLGADRPSVEARFREECRQVGVFLASRGRAGLGVETWSEVAILCPRRKWLRLASEIFIEAGLPCRLISQERLQLELPERAWPVALLHVLLNPWDRFELIGILRELFAVSDVELADAQAANKPFTFHSTHGLSSRLAAALAMLRDLHAAAQPGGSMSLAQYVGHVLDTTRLAARLAAIGQPADALARLRHDALRAELAGTPLRAWVAQLVRNLRRPAPLVAAVDDEIPLLTSQKAKGLEWPVVIPLGLARALKPRPPEYPHISSADGEVTIHISSITVDEERKESRSLATREETQRLFYVTLTRAKSLLILPDSLRLYGNSKESFMEVCRWEGLDCAQLLSPPPSAPS